LPLAIDPTDEFNRRTLLPTGQKLGAMSPLARSTIPRLRRSGAAADWKFIWLTASFLCVPG
jgi:hypothetical protein